MSSTFVKCTNTNQLYHNLDGTLRLVTPAIAQSWDPYYETKIESVDCTKLTIGQPEVFRKTDRLIACDTEINTIFPSLATGLTLYYNFAGNLKDQSKSKADGIPLGDVRYTVNRYIQPNRAVSINTSTIFSGIKIPAGTFFTPAAGSIFCAIYRAPTVGVLSPTYSLINLGPGTKGNVRISITNTYSIQLYIINGIYEEMGFETSSNQLTPGWNALTVVFNANKCAMFVNGIPIRFAELCPLPVTFQEGYIGTMVSLDSNQLTQRIVLSDLRLYNRALVASDINALWQYNRLPTVLTGNVTRQFPSIDALYTDFPYWHPQPLLDCVNGGLRQSTGDFVMATNPTVAPTPGVKPIPVLMIICIVIVIFVIIGVSVKVMLTAGPRPRT